MKWQHVAAVKVGSAECSWLLRLNTRKKDLPSKPKLGKKPMAPVMEDEESDEEEEPNEEGDV
jgi:hypothetical protein